MKLIWAVILLVAAAVAASPDAITGTWQLDAKGPNDRRLKTVGTIVLDLKVSGDTVSGMAHIGSWPGDAPIADGKIDGDRVTFSATGHLNSSSGIPTCKFTGIVQGDAMNLTMTATAFGQTVFEFAGNKRAQ
jgi:hypothetical protein